MHPSTLLSLVFTTTTLALPRPQNFLTGIPGVYTPDAMYRCYRHGLKHCSNSYITGDQPDPEKFYKPNDNNRLDARVGTSDPTAAINVKGEQVKEEEVKRDKVRRDEVKGDELKTDVVKRDQVKRQEEEAGVFYCQDVGWTGECLYRTSPLGSDPRDCTMLNLEASSIGPDQGYYCVFYTNAVCAPLASDGSDTLTLSYPGTDNLGFTEKGDFNDRLLSYQCFREESVSLAPVDGDEGKEVQGEGKTE